MKQTNRDRLIEDLEMVRSRLDEAYETGDKEWIKYLQDLQTMIYKALSASSKEKL